MCKDSGSAHYRCHLQRILWAVMHIQTMNDLTWKVRGLYEKDHINAGNSTHISTFTQRC